MTREQALDILCAFQAWRRYDGPIGEGPIMPAPREIGEAIDIAIEVLQAKEVSQLETEQVAQWTIDHLRKARLENEGLPVRALNLCKALDIYDVWELAGWPRGSLMKTKSLGKKTFHALEATLEKYGLEFGMWESPSYKSRFL